MTRNLKLALDNKREVHELLSLNNTNVVVLVKERLSSIVNSLFNVECVLKKTRAWQR